MRALAITAAMAFLSTFATTPASPAVGVEGGDAPFGLPGGPVDAVPRPLKVDREANLTALHHPHGWPPALGAGTAEVVLVVCRDEGLRQVVRVGLPTSGEALARTRRAIHDEGVRRHGEPAPGPAADSELRPGCRALLASREVTDVRRERVMTAVGPGYPACSAARRDATGHPAGVHVAEPICVDAP
ncbi:threonyl-trna synthetase [Methylobacterium fujisawaense]|uniref:threonyl-trna synthetase n=1 Tax=Methylobacterium fujisawaense TaxID=107400 RepID=UPI002F3513D5